MQYRNPIIPGFYADPSICKKGKDYYLVTSSFEFFPGVPIFHSTDLVNWRQIGHCLTRKSQLDLEGIRYSRGIYAPTIRYNPHDDLFYMVTTNVTKIENFYVTAKDPAGEWSDPVLVEQGGIDPSLFFEDDGTAHFISNARQEAVYPNGFLCAPIDLATGKFTRPAQPLWGGIGENAPEAPHIYKINGWYYQLIAEGGTELGHMCTIARSKTLYGTYEPCPHNPILTHRNRKGDMIQATGHADFIEDNDGNWWAVFLAYRQTSQYFHHIGRETCLAPVEWVDGWPVINGGRPITFTMEGPGDAVQKLCTDYSTRFADGIDLHWACLRNPDEDAYGTSEAGLCLRGNAATLSDQANPAFLGFRQRDLDCTVETELSFTPGREGEEAGISIFYKHDAHIDLFLTRQDGEACLCVRKAVGDLQYISAKIPAPAGRMILSIRANKDEYTLRAAPAGGDGPAILMGTAHTRNVSTEAHILGFTGTFLALYATGAGAPAGATATFHRFDYVGLDK